jgi:hypothetical protein
MSRRRGRRDPIADDDDVHETMDIEVHHPDPPYRGRRERAAAERAAAAAAGVVAPMNDLVPLAPLVFVVISFAYEGCTIYSFSSQDEEKRRRVSNIIMRLAGISVHDDHGPSMTDYLLGLITGIYNREEDIPAEYDQEVIEAYMAIHPLQGEWASALHETMFALPSASTTVIAYGGNENRERH